ncbi:hypothetical protein [Chelatococcus reniformis]|uniref:hypothetical protein n=1 Tax=Chelatococcus reniformis TaxID=1494448 RepID=UPI001663A0A1|nr:hypothetical protein [Chelatococcus reniformis]
MRLITQADPLLSMGSRAIAIFQFVLGPAVLAGGGATLAAVYSYSSGFYESHGWSASALIVLTVGVCAWLLLSAASYLWYASAKRRAEIRAFEFWASSKDSVNPLDAEFNNKRVAIQDLANPIERSIENKRFIGCELCGPCNIILFDMQLINISMVNCDIVVLSRKVFDIYNAIAFKNSSVLHSKLYHCTLYIHPDMAKQFLEMGAKFITNIEGAADNGGQPTS